MLDNEYKIHTATATISSSTETLKLKETHLYCMRESDLKWIADHLFERAYEKLEKTLFFATGFGVVLGMIIMAVVK